MGPKRGYQRKGNTSTNNQTDNTDNTATDDAREWDGKPFDEVTWYTSNLKMLYNEVAGAREFCTSGLVVSDKKVSVISVQHAQAYMDGTLEQGTLNSPFDATTLPDQCTPVAPIVAAPPAGAPAAQAPAPIIPTSIKELAGGDRFQVAPETIAQREEDILRHFTDRITDAHLRVEIVEEHDNQGTRFIRNMTAKMARHDSTKMAAASTRAAQLRVHRAAGFADTSTKSLTNFLNKDKDLNDTLSGTPKYEDDDLRAVALDEVLQEHSSELYTLITVELNRLRTEAMIADPPVRLPKLRALTMATQNEFSKVEIKAMRLAAEDGRVLNVRKEDPKRDTPRSDRRREPGSAKKKTGTPYVKPTVWVEPMRLCSICASNPINGGKHLDAKCPSLLKGNDSTGGTAKLSCGTCDDDNPEDAMLKLFDGSQQRTMSLDDFSQSPAELLAALADGQSGRIAMTGQFDALANDDDDDDVPKPTTKPTEYEIRNFYVMPNADETGGIFYGRLNTEVVPMLSLHYTKASRDDIVAMLLSAFSVQTAVAACREHDAPTIFHGPAPLHGYQPLDDMDDNPPSLINDSSDSASTASAPASYVSHISIVDVDAPSGVDLVDRRPLSHIIRDTTDGDFFISTYPGLEGVYCTEEMSGFRDGIMHCMFEELKRQGVSSEDMPSGLELIDKTASVAITNFVWLAQHVKQMGLSSCATLDDYRKLRMMVAIAAYQRTGARGKGVCFRGPDRFMSIVPGATLTTFTNEQAVELLKGAMACDVAYGEIDVRAKPVTDLLVQLQKLCPGQEIRMTHSTSPRRGPFKQDEVTAGVLAKLAMTTDDRSALDIAKSDSLRIELANVAVTPLVATKKASSTWRHPELATAGAFGPPTVREPPTVEAVTHELSESDRLRNEASMRNDLASMQQASSAFFATEIATLREQIAGASLPSSKLKAQEDLRLERKHELEKYADERESRLRRERNQGYIKFAGYAALQLFLITLAFMAHKYIVNAGALLPIVCVAATSVPIISSLAAFVLTVASLSMRQANFQRPWLPGSTQDRARRKTRHSLYHLIVDESPLWVKVIIVIIKFFQTVPSTCLLMTLTFLLDALLGTCREATRGAIQGRRRARSYLLGRVPASILRAFKEDSLQVIALAIWIHETLSLNWPLRLALRLATGASRLQRFCKRAICFGILMATWSRRLLSLNWPLIVYRLALTLLERRVPPPTSDDAPSEISTAHEVKSPDQEDYHYVGPRKRLLHLWNESSLATKPQSFRSSLYASLAAGERARSREAATTVRGRNGRVLILPKAGKTSPAPSTEQRGPLAWIHGVIDSGCSWHVHYRREDLVNIRPCADTFRGIDKHQHRATGIGDMPVVVKDIHGKHVKVLIRNVRLVPTLRDTLFSVDQFWEDSKVDTVFRDMRCVVLPPSQNKPSLSLPFVRRGKLFQWSILPLAAAGGQSNSLAETTARALKAATIHSPASSSHVASLPPDQMIEVLHRRLHLGFDLLRRLGDLAADIPTNVRSGKAHSCTHCKTANATHLSHNGSAYKPSYPGRLVHADIAGPFRRSVHGQHQYFLILIDDHTRWKEVYFLKKKSEALAKIRSFIAKFKSVANQGRDEPTRIVGTLHTDNAGEFLSRQFEELLADETMEHTRCPAHVHQLNGVAERSIRSILEIVRANLDASRAPVGFWPYMVEHAVDCLNRTTGPPDAGKTAYEMLTGNKPKVMAILPFGCRAYAVKPRATVLKSNFAARAWIGINLGRARHTPGAYNVWLPVEGKVVCTSEVYFDEGIMPWRPKGDQRIGESMPTPPPTATEVDELDEAPPAPTPSAAADAIPPLAVSAAEAFDRATRGDTAIARRSRKVLLLFSGPYRRPDGLAAFLTKFGLEPVLLDNDPISGGGSDGDILNDDVHNNLLQRIGRGEFLSIIAAPPCSTFSISRHFAADGSTTDDGPPVVRTRDQIRGLPDVPAKHRRELRQANAIVARMVALLTTAFATGTQYVVENPADRGDPAHPRRFLDPDHGPLWSMPEIRSLQSVSAKMATFPMCAFNAPWQKYTSLLYSSGFDEWLDPLDRLPCEHTRHEKMAGGVVGPNGIPSSETSAYPTDFNHYLARAVRSLVDATDAFEVKPKSTMDVRTHAPDGGATIDPATLPQLLKQPPIAANSHHHATHEANDDEPAMDASPDDDVTDDPPPPSPTPASPQASPARQARNKRSPFVRGAGPQLTRRSAQRHGATLAPGLNNTEDWRDSPLNALRQVAGEVIFSVTGGDGFAAFRDPDSIMDGLSDLVASDSEGYAVLAKPNEADPKTQADAYARDRDGWRASEQKEIDNHLSNGSWVLEERSKMPRGRNLIKLVWVYKTKRDGTLKSRLCVQGCRQVKGIDYDQTWCGTMRGASLRLLSSIAAKSNMRMRRWDFVAAYLQGELLDGEVIYCLPPQGPGYATIGKDGLPMVCKIVKPVYGMAQAGRRWQRSLYPWLKEYGFRQISPDSSVFTLKRTMDSPDGKREETIHLGAYVDDLCVLYDRDDKSSLYHDFITKLQDRWKVEDEGDLHDLLGIEFRFDNDTITLHQQTYIDKLCADFLPDGVPPQFQANKPPCDHNLPLHVVTAMSQDANVVIESDFLRRYQSLVGALLYCSGNTRPDVAFAVGMLCRAMSKPTPELFQDGLRVLSYLHRTRHIGLRYQSDGKPLRGQSDSDWGVRHSTSGWQFSYSQAVISWGSKKQVSVALSSCEAEIMAASEAAKEALFLSRFLDELGHGSSEPIEMGMDNQAAIAISYNPELHARTKHIDRRHFFIRECVENMQLRVPYVNTIDNLADFFTKPLAKNDFFRMRDVLMNVPSADCVPVSRDRKTQVRGGE